MSEHAILLIVIICTAVAIVLVIWDHTRDDKDE